MQLRLKNAVSARHSGTGHPRRSNWHVLRHKHKSMVCLGQLKKFSMAWAIKEVGNKGTERTNEFGHVSSSESCQSFVCQLIDFIPQSEDAANN